MSTMRHTLTGVILVLALLAGGLTAVQAATTTITGTAGSRDSWNTASNWDFGVPTGSDIAIVGDGVLAQVNNNSTPTYSGGLTLGLNSKIQIGWNNTPGSANALGSGPITMNAGSEIISRALGNYDFTQGITLDGDATIWAGISTSNHHTTKTFSGGVSGAGQLTYNGVNNTGFVFNTDNSAGWTGGFQTNDPQNQGHRVRATSNGAFGTGNVTINKNATLEIASGLNDTIDNGAALSLNGPKDSRRATKLILDSDETVDTLWYDGAQLFAGTYTNSESWLSGGGTLTVLNGPPDLPPTLLSIKDEFFESGPNAGFDKIWEDFSEVNYTVTFSDDMDESTVEAGDFENGGGATIGIGTVSETLTPPSVTLPSEYGVQVLPSSTGTLQLQIKAGAGMTDEGGNPLDTTSALPDDDTITILPGNMPDATITGTAGGGNSWNDPNNWLGGGHNFVPFGPGDAIVAAGVTAQVNSTDTPSYTGDLVLMQNATIRINNANAANMNAFGSGNVVMNTGSTIQLADGSPDLGDIELKGNASINFGGNPSHHETVDFNGDITGPGALSMNGVNNDTINFNAANSLNGLSVASSANQGFRVNANASGSLGVGDVTIGNDATLEVNAEDAMGDGATLALNGRKDSRRSAKLIMDANDTVFGMSVDSSSLAPGVYNSGSGLVDTNGVNLIDGNGDITVTGLAARGTAGTWDMTWTGELGAITVEKTANDIDPFDIEIETTGGQQTMDIIETVFNESGIDWLDYHFILGTGLGEDFVPSTAGDGLGFRSALSVGQLFPNLDLSEDEAGFDGATVLVGDPAGFELSIALPGDDNFTFTLRQYPTVIPEPSTAILCGLALIGLCRRRRG